MGYVVDLKRISAKVTARTLLAMAYDRNTFKDKVIEHVVGALREFYKAQLAEKNGKTKWVQHWRTESRQLLENNLDFVLEHPTRGNWNKKRAVEEALSYVRSIDNRYRTKATNQVLKDFELMKLKRPLDDSDTEAFYELVGRVVDAADL